MKMYDNFITDEELENANNSIVKIKANNIHSKEICVDEQR